LYHIIALKLYCNFQCKCSLLFVALAVQNLERGVRLAESLDIWVHLYGNNVLAYFLRRPESSQIGNSFTIDFTRWLKNPKLPFLVRNSLFC